MATNPWYRLTLFRAMLALGHVVNWRGARAVGWLADLVGRPVAGMGMAAAADNLRVATGLGGAELRALARRTVRNFLRMLTDYFYCTARPSRIDEMLETSRGHEHLQAALAGGRGAILVAGHLGNWELGGILLAWRGFPMTIVTLDEPDVALTEWRERWRERAGVKTVTIGSDQFSFLDIVGALRRNECVAMLVDRPHAGTGQAVTLFGRPTAFAAGPALLSHHTGAPVLPAHVLATPGGKYASLIGPPIAMAAGPTRATLATNTQRIADAFAPLIAAHPDQWYQFVRLFPAVPPAVGGGGSGGPTGGATTANR